MTRPAGPRRSFFRRKSTLVVLGLLAVVILGANANQKADDQPNKSSGRFQLRVAGTSMNVDAFVLDTVTGQVWQKGTNVGTSHTEFYKPKPDAEANAG